MIGKENLTVGEAVKVFDRNGRRVGQPEGGWDGTITKIGRSFVTIDYRSSDRNNEFRITTQATRDGFKTFRTLEQHKNAEEMTYLLDALRRHGIYSERARNLPRDKMKRIVAILEEGE